MRLHSDYPYWMISEGLGRSYPTLRENLRADVAVIGTGITGALIAHALCKAGLDVVMVDKRRAGHGSTSASTALLQYEIDEPMFKLQEKFGTQMGQRAYELCSEAIDQLATLSTKLGGDVEFERLPSLWYASYKKHVEELLKPELKARLAAGFDVRYLDAKEIEDKFGFKAPGAILSQQAAQVNPYRLTNHLLERITKLGGRIFESSTVAAIEPATRKVILQMEDGCIVTTKHVVIAAGYEAESFLPERAGTLHSSYAIVSKPLPKTALWHKRALLWDTSDPYHYYRTTSDHRIIVGGRDETFYSPAKRDALLPRKSRELLKDFQKLFPDVPFELDFWWAGTFAETKDGLPYVGPCNHKRVLYALGYGGNGITFSTIAANLLRDRVLGKKNPDADIFGFDR